MYRWYTLLLISLFYSNRMAGVQEELDETKGKSATALLASEDEISQLKAEWVKSSLMLFLFVFYEPDVSVPVCMLLTSSWRRTGGSSALWMTTSGGFAS